MIARRSARDEYFNTSVADLDLKILHLSSSIIISGILCIQAVCARNLECRVGCLRSCTLWYCITQNRIMYVCMYELTETVATTRSDRVHSAFFSILDVATYICICRCTYTKCTNYELRARRCMYILPMHTYSEVSAGRLHLCKMPSAYCTLINLYVLLDT